VVRAPHYTFTVFYMDDRLLFSFFAQQETIRQDLERKIVMIIDGHGQLALRLNYDRRRMLDRVIVH